MSSVYFTQTYQRSFGTWPLKGEQCASAMAAALDVGYRAFDTAQMYGNEADVGAALAGSDVARDDLLITTKVHPDNYTEARFIPSVEASLEALQVSQVDVLLLHWPPIGGDVAPSLKLLSQARARGLTRHIGISNYTVAMMRAAREAIDDPIVTNQVEFHPLLDQSKLLAASAETGIALASYCSVARGAVFKHPEFAEIGATYGKSAAQVVLRWILQKGVSINTMSTKPANIAANFDVMDFTLSSVDLARIEAKTATGHRCVDTGVTPWIPEWD
ncbi:MAG: aldo/keto reductase [Acuticoccus sp.]